MRRLTLRGGRLPQAALGHEALGQEQERLVPRRLEAVLGMRGVDGAPRLAQLEPAGALARVQRDELRAVVVGEQPGAPPARWQIGLAGQLDPGLGARAELDGHHDGEAIGAAPAEQLVTWLAELLRLHARARPALGWCLRSGRLGGQRGALDNRLARGVERRPGDDALDVDVDRDAV